MISRSFLVITSQPRAPSGWELVAVVPTVSPRLSPGLAHRRCSGNRGRVKERAEEGVLYREQDSAGDRGDGPCPELLRQDGRVGE